MPIKNRRELERIAKGFANHRRIQILELLAQQPGLSLGGIAEETHCDFRTIAEHVRKLAIGGLVEKRNQAQAVHHSLSERGRRVLDFLRRLE